MSTNFVNMLLTYNFMVLSIQYAELIAFCSSAHPLILSYLCVPLCLSDCISLPLRMMLSLPMEIKTHFHSMAWQMLR